MTEPIELSKGEPQEREIMVINEKGDRGYLKIIRKIRVLANRQEQIDIIIKRIERAEYRIINQSSYQIAVSENKEYSYALEQNQQIDYGLQTTASSIFIEYEDQRMVVNLQNLHSKQNIQYKDIKVDLKIIDEQKTLIVSNSKQSLNQQLYEQKKSEQMKLLIECDIGVSLIQSNCHELCFIYMEGMKVYLQEGIINY